MKKLLTILFVLTYVLTFGQGEIKPTTSDFKSLQSPTFGYQINKRPWIYMGSLYGWKELAGWKKIADTLSYYKLYSDTLASFGYTRRDRLASELVKKENILIKGNLTESVIGLEFTDTRQVIGGSTTLTLSSGYVIPTTAQVNKWDNSSTTTGSTVSITANSNKVAIGGTSTQVTVDVVPANLGTIGLVVGSTGTDVSVTSPVTLGGTLTLTVPTASTTSRGVLSSEDWATFKNKQNTLTAGSGITISGTTISSSGGGVTSVGTINTYTSTNGATISGTSIYMQNASSTLPGLISTGTQTFSGEKTFNNLNVISPSFLTSYLYAFDSSRNKWQFYCRSGDASNKSATFINDDFYLWNIPYAYSTDAAYVLAYNSSTKKVGYIATPSGGGSSGVTAVGLSMPSSVFSVANSPITSSGSLVVSLISQSANTVFAPPSGSSGTPSFRSLVNADIPSSLTGKSINGVTLSSTGSSSYFLNQAGSYAIPAGGSGMVYPGGSGISIVSGGNSWGTTISLPNNTTTYLRGDGTFATPSGGSMVYPGAGIPKSTGSAWGTSYSTSGSGNVALTISPSFTTPSLGVATATSITLGSGWSIEVSGGNLVFKNNGTILMSLDTSGNVKVQEISRGGQ